MIGLMMIREEQDMLNEALNNHSRFCDSIFVLDGTKGEGKKVSEEICRSYEVVKEYWQDEQAGLPLPLRDGARQFLLDMARKKFGTGNWCAILHGDEIWAMDPYKTIQPVYQENVGIAIHLYHFIPHISQKEEWNYGHGVSIESLCKWYMFPPIWEFRLFRDSGKFDYPTTKHSITIPPDLPTRESNIVVKQYNYRTPEQAHRRALQRKQANWQQRHYEHLLDGTDSFFIATLAAPGRVWGAQVPPGGGEARSVLNYPLPVWND